MRETLERYFEFARLEANWKTEILAGFTTFMTMAYIQVYRWNAVID
jgi:AGZA family xanthine/uracil permease-like MFS transporter